MNHLLQSFSAPDTDTAKGRSHRFVSTMCIVALLATLLQPAQVRGQVPVGSFGGLTPARLMDSRGPGLTVDGVGSGGGLLSAGATVSLAVLGRGGVPLSGVGSVVLNVTSTGSPFGGYLTVWPSGVVRPNASNLNFGGGVTIANTVVATVGVDGSVSIFSSGATHLIVDVQGWFPGTPANPTPVDCATGLPGREPLAPAGPGTLTVIVNPCQVVRSHRPTEFAVRVQNTGAVTVDGPISVVVGTPSNTVALDGTGWSCQARTCTRQNSLGAGIEAPPIRVVATFQQITSSIETAYLLVNATSPSGPRGVGYYESTLAAQALPNLVPAIEFQNFSVAAGRPSRVVIRVRNIGGVSYSGTVRVVALNAATVKVSGTGWSCDSVCTINQTVGVGAYLPTLTLDGPENGVRIQTDAPEMTDDNVANMEIFQPSPLNPRPPIIVSTLAVGAPGEVVPLSVHVLGDGMNSRSAPIGVDVGLPGSPLVIVSGGGNGWSCTGTQCQIARSLGATDELPVLPLLVRVPMSDSGFYSATFQVRSGPPQASAIGGANLQLATKEAAYDGIAVVRDMPRGVGDLIGSRIEIEPGRPMAGEIVVMVAIPLPGTLISGIGLGWTCSVSQPALLMRCVNNATLGVAIPPIAVTHRLGGLGGQPTGGELNARLQSSRNSAAIFSEHH